MKRTRILVLLCLALATGIGQPASAATITVGTNGVFVPDHFLLPYAFYSQFFGAAGAVAYGASGTPQKQMSYVASAMAGTEGSVAVFFLGKDIQMPFCDRLFLDPWLSAGYYQDQNVFIQGNPNYANQQAGSNGSDKNNYVSGDGTDIYAYLNFRYDLPLGAVRDNPIPTQVVDRGMLVSGATGGKTWNPLTSGITEIQFQPFSRQQTVDSPDVTTSDIRTTGLTTGLAYDNRDFQPNPSCGSYQQVSFSRDFGVPDSTATWSAVQANMTSFSRSEPPIICGNRCWRFPSGPPRPSPGRNRTRERVRSSPTGRPTSPAPRSADCFACALIRPAVSATSPPSIIARSIALSPIGIRSTTFPTSRSFNRIGFRAWCSSRPAGWHPNGASPRCTRR